MSRSPGLPDWRNARAYEPLLQAERPMFAWEWLRRQPFYRAAAVAAGAKLPALPLGIVPEEPRAAPWGLHVFEDPALSAGQARPVWRADCHPFVLKARAEPSSRDRDAFALDRVSDLATLVGHRNGERLLLSDGYRSIRVDVEGASLSSGPVLLTYELEGIAAAKAALLVLQRFVALASNNILSRSLHPPDRRARRQVLLLRACDALRAGADQRTIAAELLSGRAADNRWRIHWPSLRSQVQRLVHGARSMADGGFWDLLR